jgi:hypothetical protein
MLELQFYGGNSVTVALKSLRILAASYSTSNGIMSPLPRFMRLSEVHFEISDFALGMLSHQFTPRISSFSFNTAVSTHTSGHRFQRCILHVLKRFKHCGCYVYVCDSSLFSATFIYMFRYYLKVQFLPNIIYTASPLQRPDCPQCSGNLLFFVLRIIRNM